jgi:hypothetical protein
MRSNEGTSSPTIICQNHLFKDKSFPTNRDNLIFIMEICREQEQFHSGQGFAKTLSKRNRLANSLLIYYAIYFQIQTVFQVKMPQLGHNFGIFLHHPGIFRA